MVNDNEVSADALVRKANNLADAGDHVQAMPLFREAIRLGRKDARLNLGNSLEEVGDAEGAIETLSQAWTDGDSNAGYNLACLLQDTGQQSEAINIFEQLAAQNYSAARIPLAWHYRSLGNEHHAFALLNAAIEDPGDAGDLAAGTAGFWRAEAGESSPEVERLLRRGSDAYPTARAQLAMLLLARGDTLGGEALLERGSTAGEAESLLPLANLKWKNGQIAAAVALFLRSYEQGDKNSAYNLGLLMKERGREADAEMWFERSKLTN